MNYRLISNHIFKTNNPNLIITWIRPSHPFIINSVEKYMESCKTEKLQNDDMYLDIISQYYKFDGNPYVPMYFEPDVPKLGKLQKYFDNDNPINKLYPCICYVSSRLSVESSEWYAKALNYWINNIKYKHNIITEYLVKYLIKSYIYEQTRMFDDKQRSRRFDVIENKNLSFDINTKDEYLSIYDNLLATADIYRIMFEYFK